MATSPGCDANPIKVIQRTTLWGDYVCFGWSDYRICLVIEKLDWKINTTSKEKLFCFTFVVFVAISLTLPENNNNIFCGACFDLVGDVLQCKSAMLSSRSVGTHQGNALTRKLLANALPQLSQFTVLLWTAHWAKAVKMVRGSSSPL